MEVDIVELIVVLLIDGEVIVCMVEMGKNFLVGLLFILVVDINNVWFIFYIREDYLSGLKVDD